MTYAITTNGQPLKPEMADAYWKEELKKMAEDTKRQLHELTEKEQKQIDQATD